MNKAIKIQARTALQHLKLFRINQDGNVVVTFTLLSTVLVCAAGAAVDYSAAIGVRTDLHQALDAAVLMAASSGEDDKVSIAKGAFLANFNANFANKVTSSFTDTSGVVTGTASVDMPTQVLRAAGMETITLGAESAAAYSTSSACIFVLDPNADSAFKANGSGMIDMPECEMHVHSDSDYATYTDSKQINPQRLCVKGKIAGNARPRPSSFESHCDVAPDPYADSIPDVAKDMAFEGSCVPWSDMPDQNASKMVFKPGTYCHWPNINGNVTEVKFQPGDYYIKSGLSMNSGKVEFGAGTYVFDGAGLTFNGSVETVIMGEGLYGLSNGARIIFNDQVVTGDGVSIYLADKDSSFLTVNGRTQVTLTAPTSGTYKDLVIFEKPGLETPQWSSYNLDGGMNLEGLVYLPSRNLHFNGSGEMNGKALSLVLNKLSLDGHITIKQGISGGGAGTTTAYLLR